MNYSMRFSQILSLVLTASFATAPLAQAADFEFAPPEHSSCSYSKNYPCTGVEGRDAADALVDGHCQMLKKNDSSCKHSQRMAVAYTTVAAACAAVCFSSIASMGATNVATLGCTYGAATLGIVDMVWATKNQFDADWSESKKSAIVSRAGELVGGYASPIVNLFLSYQGYQASAAAAKEVIGTQAHDSAMQDRRRNACIAAVVNGTIAAVRYTNWGLIAHGSSSTYKDMCQVEPKNCFRAGALPPGQLTPGASGPQNGLAGGASTPPVTADLNARDQQDFLNKVTDDANKGELASSYASADETKQMGLGGSNPKDGFNKALESLKGFGVTPAQLADSIAKNGVGETLARFAEGNAEGANLMRQIETEARKLSPTTLSSMMAFEGGTPSGGGSKAAADSESPFAALFGAAGDRGPATGGVKEVKFGGFNGDIWHAGTQKSIFEIVSDRMQVVRSRVGAH